MKLGEIFKKAIGELDELPTARSFINGCWFIGNELFKIRDPNINQVIGYSADCTETEVKKAFLCARTSQQYWHHEITILEKEAVYRKVETLLEKYRPYLLYILTHEMGKTAITADADITEAIHCVQHYYGELSRVEGEVKKCQVVNKMALTRYEPFGTVLAITPWNFFAIPFWKIFGSITGGNAVVLKDASYTPFMSTAAVWIISEAMKNVLKEKYENVKGLVQLLHGRGETTGEEILKLAENRAFDLVAFTGGKETGRHVAEICARNFIPYHLELGGHGTIIFMDDYPIDKGVNEIILAAFGDAGQRCVTTKEVLIEEAIFDEVVEKVIQKTGELRIGPAWDVETKLGPLVSTREREKILELVAATCSKKKMGENGFFYRGGIPINARNYEMIKLSGLYGYNFSPEFETNPELLNGAFYFPTIFVNAPRESYAMQHEIFGPVLCLTCLKKGAAKQDTLDNGIKIINESPYGLSNSVLTYDMHLAFRAMERLQTGILYVGRGTTGAELGQYFGGIKHSGSGREGKGVKYFTYIKQIYVDYHPETRLAQTGAKEKVARLLKKANDLLGNKKDG